MKCKICNQEAGFVTPLLNFGRCVHCDVYIKLKLDTAPPSKGWIKHAKKSEEACDKYLKKV